MESSKKPIRAILPLLRAPISEITPTSFTIALGAEYGAPTTVRIPVNTALYDLRLGDRLTIYTEILMKGATQ